MSLPTPPAATSCVPPPRPGSASVIYPGPADNEVLSACGGPRLGRGGTCPSPLGPAHLRRAHLATGAALPPPPDRRGLGSTLPRSAGALDGEQMSADGVCDEGRERHKNCVGSAVDEMQTPDRYVWLELTNRKLKSFTAWPVSNWMNCTYLFAGDYQTTK